MKDFKAALRKAQRAVAELIPYFPDQDWDDNEMRLIISAAMTLDQLEIHARGTENAGQLDLR